MISTGHFRWSRIEYRRNPARADEGSINLGILVEFTIEKSWVVGAKVLKKLSGEELKILDPIARRNFSNGVWTKMFQIIREALPNGDSEPGDVLVSLAKQNQWSVFVSPPIEVKWPDFQAKQTIEVDSAFEYIVLEKEIDEADEQIPDPWQHEIQRPEIYVAAETVEREAA